MKSSETRRNLWLSFSLTALWFVFDALTSSAMKRSYVRGSGTRSSAAGPCEMAFTLNIHCSTPRWLRPLRTVPNKIEHRPIDDQIINFIDKLCVFSDGPSSGVVKRLSGNAERSAFLHKWKGKSRSDFQTSAQKLLPAKISARTLIGTRWQARCALNGDVGSCLKSGDRFKSRIEQNRRYMGIKKKFSLCGSETNTGRS